MTESQKRPRPWPAGAAAALGATAGWVGARRLGRVAVEGGSMRPGLQPGDRLLVHRTRRLRAGDLVVLADPRAPGRAVVKRLAVLTRRQAVVLGDNPPASTDSRHYGPVPRASLEGRAWYRYAPPARAGRLEVRRPRRGPGRRR